MKILYRVFIFAYLTTVLFYFSCLERKVRMNMSISDDDLQVIFWEVSPYNVSLSEINNVILEDVNHYPRETLTLRNIKCFYWDEQIIEFYPNIDSSLKYGSKGYMSIVLNGNILYTAYTVDHSISIDTNPPSIERIIKREPFYSMAYYPFLILTPFEDLESTKTYKDYNEESKETLKKPELYDFLKKSGKLKEGVIDLYKLFNTNKIYYGGWQKITEF